MLVWLAGLLTLPVFTPALRTCFVVCRGSRTAGGDGGGCRWDWLRRYDVIACFALKILPGAQPVTAFDRDWCPLIFWFGLVVLPTRECGFSQTHS